MNNGKREFGEREDRTVEFESVEGDFFLGRRDDWNL